MGNWKRCLRIDLSFNKIRALAPDFGTMGALQLLDMKHNVCAPHARASPLCARDN
jgi:hypothetical protein